MKIINIIFIVILTIIACMAFTGCEKDEKEKTDKIIFTSNRTGDREIFIMNADGQNPKNLTQMPNSSEYGGTLSPDGKILLFVSETANGKKDLYILKAGSADPLPMTTSFGDNLAPVWSPDGSKFLCN